MALKTFQTIGWMRVIEVGTKQEKSGKKSLKFNISGKLTYESKVVINDHFEYSCHTVESQAILSESFNIEPHFKSQEIQHGKARTVIYDSKYPKRLP